MQQEQRVVGFFWTYGHLYPVSRDVLRGLASQYHHWVRNRSERWGAPLRACFTPFFTEKQRQQAGCRHGLFFSPAESCDHLVFHRRSALEALPERWLDAHRTIGRPHRLTVIFGRKITRFHRGKLQTVIEELHLASPVKQALSCAIDLYKLGSLRYDLSKRRAKSLVEKLPHSRRYRLLPHGDQICLVYLKLFEKIYAPLTAGILAPCPGDNRLAPEQTAPLDRRWSPRSTTCSTQSA